MRNLRNLELAEFAAAPEGKLNIYVLRAARTTMRGLDPSPSSHSSEHIDFNAV